MPAVAQIPWGDEFEHETGRELFSSNLLALTWIKGEAMPNELVDEIMRGLGLERETGELPKLDALTIEDPAKRELIEFALRNDPAERPTADELLEKITILAPGSMMQSEFRAQVFASMRFNDHGPRAEAKVLRGKLAAQGVHLHIIEPLPGESIDKAVFGTMAKCDAFLAMATKDYGANTGNTASTYHEVRKWREEYQPKGKPLIPLRMVRARACVFRRDCAADTGGRGHADIVG